MRQSSSCFFLKERNLVKSKLPSYYSEDMLGIISSVKQEGFNINTKSLKTWYKYLLEVQVTHTEDTSVLEPCRAERLAPVIDWGRSWRAIRFRVYLL